MAFVSMVSMVQAINLYHKAAEMLDKPIEDLRIISCHIGNGASIAAIDGGKSIDTSMGFTPLAGVTMGTRSGNIDPALIPFIMEKQVKLLNKYWKS